MRRASGKVVAYKPRVVVADDIGSTRMLLTEVLTTSGFNVSEARTAGDVFKLVADGHFESVVLNLTMPPHRGPEYVKKVRDLMRPEAKLIVYTADQDGMTMDSVLRAGADLFLPNPIPLHRLLKSLED